MRWMQQQTAWEKRKMRQEIGFPRDKIMGAVFKCLPFLGSLCADTRHHIDLSVGKREKTTEPDQDATPSE